MARRSYLSIAVAAVAATVLTACGSGGTSSGDGQGKVSLTVAMGHEAPYPGEEAVMYAVPKALGLFDELGIDVTYEPTQGSGVAVQLVQAGQADLGQGNPSAVMAAIAEGATIKMVYNIIPTYGSGLAVLPDSPITSPTQLRGKTIGVSSLSSSRLLDAKEMVKSAGLDPERDVSFAAVGTGAQAAAALTSGQVDGLYLWDAAYKSIELSGTQLRVIKDVFPNSDRLLDYVQYASEDAITKKRDAIGKLGKAAAMAQVWARNNVEAALEMFYQAFPNARPADDAGRRRDLEILKFTLEQFDPAGTAQSGWGDIPKSYVETTAEFFAANGLIKEALPYERYVDSSFVTTYNDFDEGAAASRQAAG